MCKMDAYVQTYVYQGVPIGKDRWSGCSQAATRQLLQQNEVSLNKLIHLQFTPAGIAADVKFCLEQGGSGIEIFCALWGSFWDPLMGIYADFFPMLEFSSIEYVPEGSRNLCHDKEYTIFFGTTRQYGTYEYITNTTVTTPYITNFGVWDGGPSLRMIPKYGSICPLHEIHGDACIQFDLKCSVSTKIIQMASGTCVDQGFSVKNVSATVEAIGEAIGKSYAMKAVTMGVGEVVLSRFTKSAERVLANGTAKTPADAVLV